MGLGIFVLVAMASVAAMWFFHPFRQHRIIDMVLIALTAPLFGALAFTATIVSPDGSPFVIAVASCAPPFLAFVILRQRRRLFWHTKQAIDSFDRPGGLSSLRAHLGKKKVLARTQDARRAAWMLAEAGLIDEAAVILQDVPLTEIHPRWAMERAGLANDLAAYQIRTGETKAARDLLRSIEERPRAIAAIIASKEALLEALEGEPEEALAMVERIVLPAQQAPHQLVLELARAHAHAAQGDQDAARDALRAVVSLEPEKWLDRASTPSGPATALAIAMAAEQETPYR